MKTTRRNFLASIPFVAALFGIKADETDKCKCDDLFGETLETSTCGVEQCGCHITITGTAGDKLLAGQCVFIKEDGKFYSTGEIPIGIAMESAKAQENTIILIQDTAHCVPYSHLFFI